MRSRRKEPSVDRTAATQSATPDSDEPVAPVLLGEPGQPRLLTTIMLAVGVVVFAVGAMWFWQSWSQRSGEPIDDLLPRLAVPEVQAGIDPATEPPASSPRSDAADVDTGTNPDEDVGVGEMREAREMIVHVSGAVAEPGIVRIVGGGRVFEAVELAGGASADADLDRVNLAAIAVDGERIHIPAFGETVPPALVPAGVAGSQGDIEPELVVDINRSSIAELEQLPGIGPSIAAAIVRTRELRGPFLDVEELQEVAGIGVVKLAEIRPFVRVG